MSRILVVDDERTIVRMMERVLKRDAHEVVTATDGKSAVQAALNHTFDVAFVDYLLPDFHGLTVIQELCKAQPGCARILMSGQLDTPLVINAVNQGRIHRVLPKPISLDALQEAIRVAVGLHDQLVEGLQSIQEAKIRQEQRKVHELLDGGKLRLALQPILSASDRRLVAHEALMRSQHPALPNPLVVLHAAEQCQMIPDVGAEVARLAALWVPRVPEETMLFVNLHPIELQDSELLMRNLSPLRPWADRIVLEITEHSQAYPGSAWMKAVQVLRMAGFAIAVDDLGAGYNSLAILANLQPDYIKVDMSIVRDIDCDPYKQRLIALLVQLADSTGSTLIAEGVETEAESQILCESGCHMLQGYYFGKPAIEPDFSRFMAPRLSA